MKKNSSASHRVVNKSLKLGLIALLIILLFSIQSPPVTHALTITVNTTVDEYDTGTDCSLREAIQAANTDSTFGGCTTGSGDDVITFDTADTYTLTIEDTGDIEDANNNNNAIGDLDIDSNITINGFGTGITIIDGNDIDRVIHTHGTNVIVNLNDLTIQNGRIGTSSGNSGNGGGIYRQSSGNMTLDSVEISSNVAGHRGGGLENGNAGGTLALTNCIVSGNESTWGGGLVSATSNAVTTITNCTFSNNIASTASVDDSHGGGLNIYFGTVTVNNSTFTSNSSSDNGGGLANQGTLNVTNSTISGNGATDGGGIYTYGTSITTVSNSTITNSTSGSGLYNGGGSITVNNSIVSNNTTRNCLGTITNDGNNLEYPSDVLSTCNFYTSDPLLGTLTDNGGDTETHALLVGSPAIDAGDCSSGPTNDQRGMIRLVDGDGDSTPTCDIGAYEAGEMQCSIDESTYIFSTQSNVTIQITTDGSDLDCLYVDERKTNHTDATSGGSGAALETGIYWVINGLDEDNGSFSPATLDYAFSLTLPFIGADDDSRVCKWVNGAGSGWNCGLDASNTPNGGISVTRIGLDSFSEWAVGDIVGPTAVSFQSVTTANQPAGWVVLLFSVLMLTMGGLWSRRVKH